MPNSLRKYNPPPFPGQLIHKINQITLKIFGLLPLRKILQNLISILRLLQLKIPKQLENIRLNGRQSLILIIHFI